MAAKKTSSTKTGPEAPAGQETDDQPQPGAGSGSGPETTRVPAGAADLPAAASATGADDPEATDDAELADDPADAADVADDPADPADVADDPADPAADDPADPAFATEAGGGPAETPAGEAAAPKRSLRVPALLAVVIVLLGGFGVVATLRANSLRASNAGQNAALTDAAATSAVRHQVSSAVNQIFSYRYTDTAATRRAAQRLLTGRAIRQYDQLFSLVENQAPAEKLIVTTIVTNSGVEFLTGDRARVLVFANQQDTRAGTSQSSYAGAMFAVTAVRSGDRWKIENIDTFTGR
ncbi:MAG TPA: hypothetical protein VH641_10195 [Streptosporangiaceae bacterium]